MIKTLIKPSRGLGINNLKELWKYRELLFFLAWRNIKVRYSQAIIGILWVVIQPVMTMLIFSIIFGKFARLPSEGVPYTVFVFSALLPWNLFANSVSGAGTSLVINRSLITKIYFPRLVIPMAKVIENMLDFMISCFVMFCIMLFYGISPTKNILVLPLFILWLTILALGLGFCLSAMNVKYRDVSYAIPFLMQVWFYMSPVAYSLNLIPQKWHKIYSLNPMVGIIEGFRWSILGKACDFHTIIPLSLTITFIIFVAGLAYFCSIERTIADII